MILPWWIASIIANVACVASELLNRRADPAGGWLGVLPYTAVPIIVGAWALYYAFNGAPHWLTGWAVFTLGNALVRSIAVHFFGTADDGITSWALVSLGYGVMLAGSLIMKEGLT